MSDTTWNKFLVQQHLQVAAANALYTLPSHLTVTTSIKDTQQEAFSHTIPQYPYNNIDGFYDASRAGISTIGADPFSWRASNQRATLAVQNGVTKLGLFLDPQTAIHSIDEQGEGKGHGPAPTERFYNTRLPIRVSYQLTDGPDRNP